MHASEQKSDLRISGGLSGSLSGSLNDGARRSVKRVPYSGMRQAIAFESSVKLTVNLLLAIVATTTMAKLWPYYQSQYSRLTMLQESVDVAEQKNAELRSQFSSNFDPAQAGRIMQEQSGLSYPNQKKGYLANRASIASIASIALIQLP